MAVDTNPTTSLAVDTSPTTSMEVDPSATLENMKLNVTEEGADSDELRIYIIMICLVWSFG